MRRHQPRSQGQTADRVLIHVDTDKSELLVNNRFAYVSVSRAQYDARIYTIMPPAKNSGGRCGIGNGAGKPNNFCVPLTMYTKAAMILRMLKRYGDQRFIGPPFTSISHGQRTAERPRRCGTGARRPIPASTAHDPGRTVFRRRRPRGR
jgi:hypothetical protein